MSLLTSWSTEVLRRPSFPERLDEPEVAISILTRLKREEIIRTRIPQNEVTIRLVIWCDPVDLGMRFRGEDRHLVTDFRLEFLDIPEADRNMLFLQDHSGSVLARIARKAGLQVDKNSVGFSLYSRILLDPGDLPDVMKIDGTFRAPLTGQLQGLSRHKHLALIAEPDLELLRIP